MDVLGENNVAIKNIKNKIPKFTDVFPIKTKDHLDDLENSIDDSSPTRYSVRVIYRQTAEQIYIDLLHY